MDSKTYGKKGEDSAASFLCGKGFTIIGRNVRSNHLETDIIAVNQKYIVFAEVKTRSEYPDQKHLYGRPAANVDFAKRKRLISAAEDYIRKNRESIGSLQPRIDVIEVYIKPDFDRYKVLKIVHMENAVRRD